jgi:hypothetical protein
MWHVVRGQEEGKIVVIAARSTYVAELTLLEFHKSKDGDYKPRGKTTAGREKAKLAAYSRILVVRATLVKPWAGRTSVIIANVHLHHCTAKQAPGFQQGRENWWSGFRNILSRFEVDIIAGDFNMALWEVVPILAKAR